MFNLQDGMISIESYKIPWLIWIQILIIFLLLFLFFSFNTLTASSDLSINNTNISSALASSSSSASPYFSYKGIHNSIATVTANSGRHRNQVGGSQSIKGEIATSTSRAIVGEDNVEGDCFSTSSMIDFHPCNYFRLAKLAFLKCFGLDLTTDSCSSSYRKKER